MSLECTGESKNVGITYGKRGNGHAVAVNGKKLLRSMHSVLGKIYVGTHSRVLLEYHREVTAVKMKPFSQGRRGNSRGILRFDG